MKTEFEGVVNKLRVEEGSPVQYWLGEVSINKLIGKEVRLLSDSQKNCIHCERQIKKTFGQGYCFPCFQSLARCDTCIVRPEKCHYDKGTCREPEWGEENCLIDHTVYLSNTSGVKVGITREFQKYTRWVDQGALAALEIGIVPSRLASGLVETELKEIFADKTNWRALLTGKSQEVDLLKSRSDLIEAKPELFNTHGGSYTTSTSVVEIEYPVNSYLEKAKSGNLDKNPEISGVLHGVRGQYLLIGEVGVNVRKYQGYVWQLSAA